MRSILTVAPLALFSLFPLLSFGGAGPIPAGTTWNWDLEGGIPGGAEMIDYDPRLGDKSKKGQRVAKPGKFTICYFSAGSWEAPSCRPDVAGLKKGVDYGQALKGGNEGGQWKCGGQPERWFNIKSKAVREVIMGRLIDAKERGCDGVEPDNVDGDLDPDNTTGFNNGASTVEFLTWLSTEAHRLDLKIGLKNAGDLASRVVGLFDFVIVEQCGNPAGSECQKYKVFPKAGKAMFQAEYGSKVSCEAAKRQGFSLTQFPADQNVKNGRPCK